MTRGWLIAMLMLGAATAAAQPAPGAEPPYEAGLMRLAEVLGSLHFLRNLCGEDGGEWRDRMEKLLAAENPEPARREKLVGSFNRAYRSFESTYTVCTPSALAAIARYMKEGEALSRDIATRFGN